MSDYFKTPKGTELPFLNLKGKKYLQVMHRLVWFRETVEKNSAIKTEFLKIEDTYAIAKATIMIDGEIVAIAHGREDAKHFQDFIEKAETKAIGRALALCGFGTQFAPELDEGERLADSPTPSKKMQPTSDLTGDPSKLITELNQTISKKGIRKDEVINLSKSLFNNSNVRALNAEQLTQLINMIGGK